ncbi:alpha/beta fold hydrolase [Sphingobacterium daejeonense]|uniref:Alpha/beta fold hydrolase n=1 Tax=Sphingobacterium daejeonense TaxID=371142 RepID=A0ABW3RKB6_9SPHI
MNLKNIILTIVAIVAMVSSSKSQTSEFPFKVDKDGQGKKNIIFIPGFASSGEVWNESQKELGNDYTSYILTMPGFAGVPAQANPTFKGWRDLIIEFIKKENISNPIIIGHSLGGVMAMDIAATAPDIISKIIVVDAVPCLVALNNPAFKSNPNIDCSQMVEQFKNITDAQFLAMQKQGVGSMVSDSAKQNLVLDWTLKSDRSTFAKIYCDFSNIDVREDIKKITCPALILLNSGFSHIKPMIEQQYSSLKTADIQYADQSLHFIMFDSKDWYMQQLLNFIK